MRATAAERRHFDAVCALGCIVCGSPAEIHHVTGAGMGLRASNYDVLPLCPAHHRTGGYGIALHAGVMRWEQLYGSQAALLALVRERLQVAA